ncbi:MAG: hypothetical protein KBD01_09685 [Acidobacteria bacterium]|nr:hypothetical protein [Acidobacteriota bacterium]
MAAGVPRPVSHLATLRELPARLARRVRTWHIVALSFVPYLLVGQTWVLADWLARSVLAGELLTRPGFEQVSLVPRRLLAAHLVFLLTLALPAAWRLYAVAVGILALALGTGLVDAGSFVALAVFALAAYPVLGGRLPRWAKLAMVIPAALGLRLLAHAAGWAVLDAAGTVSGLVIFLWYATYQQSSAKPLRFVHYLAYLKTRLFMEGPVFTPQDFASGRAHELQSTRLAGVKVLVTALLARTAAHQLRALLLGAGWQQSAGWTLLGLSYVNYVALSLDIVFSYNLALGLMRLFGLAVRDNFGPWLLARTPNEHWQRWNLLYREWLITFTFYPMMRARVNLFFCVMATLLASGALHVVARASGLALTADEALLTLAYWALNGLLIYVVIAFPRRYPGLVQRLRIGESAAWSVAGWTLTSVTYAVLFFISRECHELAEVPAYFARLFGGSP